MTARLFILVPAIATLALAQEAPPPAPSPEAEKTAEPVKPSVKKLDGTRYQIGEVIFDEKTREIRFPTVVNMTEGLLEFLVVHKNGKIHEALLATEISPTHLNLAFTLLRYPPSRELYPLPNGTGGLSGELPVVPPEIKAAARVAIDVEWKEGEKVRRVPVNEWIQHEVKTTSMPAGPWVYGGSDFNNGKYAPETSGDIVSIFMSMASILNYPGTDYDNDDVWAPFPKRVPAAGTAVTVIITPYQNAKPIPKP
ncbi:hypothetical protein JIN84_13285 [Luteolibacter yonseiensis]|uniref:Uncharacterized protein n=1 Tax=Luteolibacter yonseiensis TaxID=1144680 RepID=A0A934VAV4_9BACT|nr:YdjY domain-containing protein [Luteolibacter yonseiensis]MBK1816593.1 hypothetical protein [Luteolibacter yonseiensis]